MLGRTTASCRGGASQWISSEIGFEPMLAKLGSNPGRTFNVLSFFLIIFPIDDGIEVDEALMAQRMILPPKSVLHSQLF
jgi:hypothetical protein